MKKGSFILGSLLIGLLIWSAGSNVALAKAFPGIISLPDGFRPEGVVVGKGHDIYAGSLADGSIYRADLRTGAGELAVPPQNGRIAVGLSFDERSNAIFAAGGPAGTGYVYDAATGASLAVFQFINGPTFVNDVVVTRQAAYFTDSFNSQLYVVPLGRRGQLPDPSAIYTLPLSGDYAPGPGFNVNGIDATPNGDTLIIVQSGTGTLYRVDPQNGVATTIDLGGDAVPFGDGILLAGKTLYVVQNQLNQIAVVEVDSGVTAGTIVDTISNPAFDVPTTVAEFGNRLYAVNARFGTPPTPTTMYDIVQVSK